MRSFGELFSQLEVDMSIPWMKFYPADYLADTGHLNHEEHGVYLLAMLHYWRTRKPLPSNCLANDEQLMMICRCRDAEKFQKLWETVSKFFELTPEGWYHKRIAEDLQLVESKSEKMRANGKIGGSRKKKKAIVKQLVSKLTSDI